MFATSTAIPSRRSTDIVDHVVFFAVHSDLATWLDASSDWERSMAIPLAVWIRR
jgi:hypothetical protein